MPKDPYAVLGIDPTSDTTEVKRAFRALAMQFHPVSLLPFQKHNPTSFVVLCLPCIQCIDLRHDVPCLQDVSTAPDAATRFEEVRKAADAILNRVRAASKPLCVAPCVRMLPQKVSHAPHCCRVGCRCMQRQRPATQQTQPPGAIGQSA